jgi:hypothetical protein
MKGILPAMSPTKTKNVCSGARSRPSSITHANPAIPIITPRSTGNEDCQMGLPSRRENVADRLDEAVVDSGDDGDGAATDAGDGVGGADGDALDESGGKIAATRAVLHARRLHD